MLAAGDAAVVADQIGADLDSVKVRIGISFIRRGSAW